jgi:hypothetical protein
MIYGFIRRSLGEGGFCDFTVYGFIRLPAPVAWFGGFLV